MFGVFSAKETDKPCCTILAPVELFEASLELRRAKDQEQAPQTGTTASWVYFFYGFSKGFSRVFLWFFYFSKGFLRVVLGFF